MFDAKVDPCILFSFLVYTAVWSVWSSLFVLYPQIIGEVFPKSATLLSVWTSVYKAMWSASSSFFVLYPQIIGEVFPKSATLLSVWTSVYKAMWSASSSFFVLYPQIIGEVFPKSATLLSVWTSVYKAMWSASSSFFVLYPQIIGEVFPKSATLLSVWTSVYKAMWSASSSFFVLYPQIIGEVFPKSATLLSVWTSVYKAMWSASSSFFVLYPQIIRVSLSTILILWAWLWAITHITNRVCSDFIYLCSTEIPSTCQPHTDCYLQVNLLRFHLCHPAQKLDFHSHLVFLFEDKDIGHLAKGHAKLYNVSLCHLMGQAADVNHTRRWVSAPIQLDLQHKVHGRVIFTFTQQVLDKISSVYMCACSTFNSARRGRGLVIQVNVGGQATDLDVFLCPIYFVYNNVDFRKLVSWVTTNGIRYSTKCYQVLQLAWCLTWCFWYFS